jgi:hypothetical protein
MTRRGGGSVVRIVTRCAIGEGRRKMEIAATILLVVFVIVVVALTGLL